MAAVALVLAGACSEDQEPVEIGQAGPPETVVEESTTTTTVESTATTIAPQVVEIPPLPGWADSWTGPATTLGELRLGDFNQFVLDNAPGGETTVEEAVVAYLKLDGSQDAQMLVGTYGGPEAYQVTVVITNDGDDSVRAQRYQFIVEYRSPTAEEEATEEGEAAETGDTGPIEDETAGDEAEAAAEEELSVIAGPEALPWVLNGELSVQCQPGRGHQDFTIDLCL
jgi:hypothetical protein